MLFFSPHCVPRYAAVVLLLCARLALPWLPVSLPCTFGDAVKVKAFELRKKSGADLLKQLEELRSELAKVRKE